ncbi:MAG: FtsX-like permease family protein [Verrucomicrobiota bacterium]|nr:FtsX-like permease family protein [Verrucomicrobiota bacterium]
MNPLKLIFKEIAHRKVNAVLSLLAITIAVGGAIIFHTAFAGSLQRTKRIQRDMGQNLRIVSKDTDLAHFWDEGFSETTFPENWVQSFTNINDTINYSHLSAVLKWKIKWRGSPAMIYGLAPREVAPPGRKKPIMITPVKRGTVQFGKTLAAIHGVKRDETVTVEGGQFEIARVLSEKGSGAEIRIYMHLADAQAVLKRKGEINEIQALDCYCADETQDTLALLREQLGPILPEAQVFRMQDMAEAREKQRRDIEWTFSTLMPAIVVFSGIVVGMLAFVNTRARRQEIGILRALGKGSGSVAALFLGKALLLGVAGAVCGFALGTGLLFGWGPELLKISPKLISWDLNNLKWALLLAPVFAALASFIPAMLAVTQDPADTLRHD